MYELYDPMTVMFFYRNKHIMVDMGTGKAANVIPAQPAIQDFVLPQPR